jgi:hypothetical protein
VHLIITVPEAARGSADMLLGSFLPGSQEHPALRWLISLPPSARGHTAPNRFYKSERPSPSQKPIN